MQGVPAKMSNMYGYNDYDGPHRAMARFSLEADDEDNPLQAGFWMEGDSLAPPCGTAVPTIHRMLDFAQVSSKDVVYDLGCGDARVCLEAFARKKCQSVGVEVEADLVSRGRELIARLNYVDQKRLPFIIEQDLRIVLRNLVRLAAKATAPTEQSDDIGALPLPTIIIMYLLPEALAELEDSLRELLRLLPESFRILCNTWGLNSLVPQQRMDVKEEGGAVTPLSIYTRKSL